MLVGGLYGGGGGGGGRVHSINNWCDNFFHCC